MDAHKPRVALVTFTDMRERISSEAVEKHLRPGRRSWPRFCGNGVEAVDPLAELASDPPPSAG
jgi:hypothetical protein